LVHPILDHDTALFIDPFLIFKDRRGGEFANAHAKIIRFFNRAFHLAAESGGRSGLRYRKLRHMLVFPEVPELCLGYGQHTTSGSGTGHGFSGVITAGIYDSIAAGIREVTHFEEIGLLHEGIGCDRISDITADILKEELVAYTQRTCREPGVPMERMYLRHARFDEEHLRWVDAEVRLPRNPVDERGILLVPKRYLRQLPTINPGGFWDYAWDTTGQQLRDDFGFEVKSRVSKADILRVARERRFLVRDYLRHLEQYGEPVPYDLDADRDGVYQWDDVAFAYVQDHPLRLAARNAGEFSRVVASIVQQFKHYVEQEQGYRLLWNDNGTAKGEKAAQLLFYGVVKHYCRANNIDVSREVETGRGPVDFKFSQGYEDRALIEVKLARNSKFWHGLTAQTPTYLRAAEVREGTFLIIVQTDKDLEHVTGIQRIVRDVARRRQVRLTTVVVDARAAVPSASRA